MAQEAVTEYGLSKRHACRALDISRSQYEYEPKLKDDSLVAGMLQDLAVRYSRYGFKKLLSKLRQQGIADNHKRVYRIYCEEGLNMRKRPKKRLPVRNPEPLTAPAEINSSWSIDFMSDSLTSGRRFRTFNVIDDSNRMCLAIEIDYSLTSERVVRTLEALAMHSGAYPKKLRCDNGPEFISTVLSVWAKKNNVTIGFIEPGKPAQNGFIERFNRTYREEILDMYAFGSLSEVREITDRWIYEYNYERPHESLGNEVPGRYLNAVG